MPFRIKHLFFKAKSVDLPKFHQAEEMMDWPYVWGICGKPSGRSPESYFEPAFSDVLIKTSCSPEYLAPLALKVDRNIDSQLARL
jgi:hypothetical protein